MKQEEYNEFKVQVQGGEIIEKMPTARKTVMIYAHEAERMNKVSLQTRLYYELKKKAAGNAGPGSQDSGGQGDAPSGKSTEGLKNELWEKVNALVAAGKIKKPNHLLGVKKLQALVDANK